LDESENGRDFFFSLKADVQDKMAKKRGRKGENTNANADGERSPSAWGRRVARKMT